MKVLYVMQQSIFNEDGWLSADSNINMYVGIVREILKHCDWKFYVLVGRVTDVDIEELFDHSRVTYIYNDYPVDAVLSRYHFDVHKLSNLLKFIDPDVIWNNIPELSRNFKAVVNHLRSKAKLINCNYWIDAPFINEPKVPEDVSYAFRQIDGALSADLVPFTCESTRKVFVEHMEAAGLGKLVNKVLDKSTIWDFGFSMTELEKYRHNSKFPKKTILFPNRLSGINYTHHEEFIKAVNELYYERRDFQVVFTNPSQKVSWNWLKEYVAPLHIVKEGPLSRKEYIGLLWASDIVVNLYDIERYGGCANVEAIYCGCLPIMTRYGEYINRAPKDYEFFIDLPVTVDKIKTALNKALDALPYCTDHLIPLIMKSSYELAAPTVINDIDVCVNGKKPLPYYEPRRR